MAKKNKQSIIRVFKAQKKPLMATEIHGCLEERGVDIELTTLRVVLHTLEGQGILTSVKIPGTPKLYCRPSWVNKGKLIEKYQSYDPNWNTKIKTA